jgi:membrane peptidoglycan carboxypeptidase
MKPYVLATALEQGKSLSTRYNGASHQDICGQKDVKNDEGDPPFGNIDLATGLEHSVNTVYFRLACDVGPDKVAELAHKAGIPNNELDGEGNVTAQIALGSGGYQIRPIDQAHGYSTFAANGMEATPYFVESVCKTSDKNECPYKAKVKKQRAFSADVAADTISAMERVVTGGTGTNAQIPGRPTAGKTGTTSNNTNAWFAGFTPQLTTAVWVGRKDGGPLKGVLGSESGVYGGNVPAKIFRAFMTEALQGQPVKDFPPRANVGSAATPSTTTTSTPSATPSATPSPTPSKTLPPVPTPTKVVPTLPPASPTAQPTPSSSPSPPAVQGSPAASP